MTADTYELPMFPLGSCALPGEGVPLRIFEPRYLELVRRVTEASGEFGIVLISRGFEVGGGDDRFDIGTATHIVRDVPLGEEQRAIVTLARRRIRIEAWLDDDPFPRAMVTDLVDIASAAALDLASHLQRVRRLYALASELGADVAGVDLSGVEDSSQGLWQLASLVPLAQLDRQRLLEAADLDVRAHLLSGMIDEATEELELRLSAGRG